MSLNAYIFFGIVLILIGFITFRIDTSFIFKVKVNIYWTYIQLKRLIHNTFRKIPRYLFLVFCFLTAYKLYRGENFYIDSETLSSIFIGAGAMMGGILAIAFTLNSSFLQQNQYLLSTSFFKEYIHGKAERISFFFISLLVVTYFILSFTVFSSIPILGDPKILMPFLIFTIGLSIFVLDSLSSEISNRTNPLIVIQSLKKIALKEITILSKDIERLSSTVPKQNPENRSKNIEGLFYNVHFRDKVSLVSSRISDLIYLAESLQHQVKPAEAAIYAIRDVLMGYIKIRKDNSIISLDTDGILGTNSDVQKILEYPLPEINRIVDIYATSKREYLCLKVKDLYQGLLLQALEIKDQTQTLFGENPVAEYIFFFFKRFIRYAFQNELEEVAFQSQYTLKEIALSSIKNRNGILFKEALATISWIMQVYEKTKNSLYLNQCQLTLAEILVYTNSLEVSNKKDYIEDIFETIFQFETTAPSHKYFYNAQNISLFSLKIEPILRRILNSAIDNNVEFQSFSLDFLEAYRSVIYKIFRFNPEYAKDFLISSISIVINYSIEIIQATKDQRVKERFKQEVQWYTSLISFLKPSSRKNDTDIFVNPIVRLGLLSIVKFEDLDLLNYSIDTLTRLLEKQDTESQDYYWNLNNMHLLGILLHQKKSPSSYEDFRLKLQSLVVDKEESAKNIRNWRDSLVEQRNSSIIDNENIHYIVRNVPIQEVDDYIFSIYGFCDSGCSMQKEHNLRREKQPYIIEFAEIIKLIINRKEITKDD